MELFAKWGLAIAFLGVTIGLGAQFHVLPLQLRRRYMLWFIVSIILMALGTLAQQLGIQG